MRNIKRHICPLSFSGFAEKQNHVFIKQIHEWPSMHLGQYLFCSFCAPCRKNVSKKNFFNSLKNWIIMWNFDQSIQAAMRRGGHNPTDIEVSQIQKLIVNIYMWSARLTLWWQFLFTDICSNGLAVANTFEPKEVCLIPEKKQVNYHKCNLTTNQRCLGSLQLVRSFAINEAPSCFAYFMPLCPWQTSSSVY